MYNPKSEMLYFFRKNTAIKSGTIPIHNSPENLQNKICLMEASSVELFFRKNDFIFSDFEENQ